MDDLLYILFGVIWLVLGIYKNAHKNKSNTSKKAEPFQKEVKTEIEEEKTTPIREILGDFLYEEEAKVNKKKFIYDDTISIEEKLFPTYQTSNYSLENESGMNKYKKEVEDRKKVKDSTEYCESEENNFEIEEFDIKKAILYSVIIQRPYN